MFPVILFDKDKVPKNIISPSGIDRVNMVAVRLRKRLVEKIILQEPDTTFRLSNMVRCCNQAFIQRCLHFAGRHHAAWRFPTRQHTSKNYDFHYQQSVYNCFP